MKKAHKSGILRELRHRALALVTSLALLIGLTGPTPFSFFSLVGSSQAAETGEDYAWLLKNRGTAAAPVYEIATEGQFYALSKLVEGLPTADSTMEISIGGNAYLVGPGLTDVLTASANSLSAAPALPMVTASPPPTETASPEPTETPPPEPTEGPVDEPTEPPVVLPTEPTADPSPTPTDTPSAEPSAPPSPRPSAEPPAEPSAAPPEDSSTPPAEAPAAEPAALLSLDLDAYSESVDVLEPAPSVPDKTPPSPSTAPSTGPTEEPEIFPTASPSEEPVDGPTPPPSEEPAVQPTEEPAAPPSPTPSPSPAPSPEPAPTPSEGIPIESDPPGDGDEEMSLLSVEQAAAYSLKVPVGLAGCTFKLTSDLSLSNFNGKSAGGAALYWTPIGILSGFDAASAPTGTPFLGSFDGNGHSIYHFCYAPDPDRVASDSPNMAGYGLFGYVGEGGEVKNLTVRLNTKADGKGSAVPWVLSTLQKGDTQTVSMPLGQRNYAVGVLAAAVSGKLTNCTVSQADLKYVFGPASANNILTAVGGIAGLLAYQTAGEALKGCIFLGKLSVDSAAGLDAAETNTSAGLALQGVGGIAGYLLKIGSTAVNVTLTQCAAGVEMDVFNGSGTNKGGGVGGLFGYCNTRVTLSGCFTTGVIRAIHDAGGLGGRAGSRTDATDCFSTVSIGRTTKTAAKNGTDLTFDDLEAMGGLFGASASTSSQFKNVYYAGGLLQPQFASVIGRLQSVPASFTNVAVDDLQSPQGPFKSVNNSASTAALTVARNLGGFTSALPNWIVGKLGTDGRPYGPQLKWAANSAAGSAAQALSNFATYPWVTANANEMVSGSDGLSNLYRLKDTGATAPGWVGLLTIDLATAYYTPDGKTVFGGEYTYILGTLDTVDGVKLPVKRFGITAVNQTEGRADLIDSAAILQRFTDRVNLAPGGYLGCSYTLSGNIDASGVTVPAYDRAKIKPFSGKLSGGTGSSISKISFASGATGLVDSAYSATFENFTLADVKVAANAPLGTGAGYCGFVAGRISNSTFRNVDLTGLSYSYAQTGDSTAGYQNSVVNLGLAGMSAAQSGINTFTGCDVTGLDVRMTGGTSALRVRFGGLLGENNSTSGFRVSDCTMSGTVYLDFSGSSSAQSDSSSPYVGGLIAYDNAAVAPENAKLSGCQVNANLRAYRVGGLVARGKGLALSTCTFTGNLSTGSYSSSSTAGSGGLIGSLNQNTAVVTVDRCAVFGNVASNYYAGGICGNGANSKTLTITNSYVNAVVTRVADAGYAGGLAGTAANAVCSNSYFAGQVSARGAYGAIIGQVTVGAVCSDTLYDSTLTQRGILSIGSAPPGVEIPSCGARPDDVRWSALAFDPSVWSYSADSRQAPRLVWMDAALPTLSGRSTTRLFDAAGGLVSLYNFPVGSTFSTTLPTGISGAPASPSASSSFETQSSGGATTVYLVTGNAEESSLRFTYAKMGPGGTDLVLPYAIAIKTFAYGDGTREKPFIIFDLDELKIFRAYVNSKKNASGVYYQISTIPTNADDPAAYPLCSPITIDMAVEKNWTAPTAPLAGQLNGFGSTLKNFSSGGVKDAATNVWTAGLLNSLAPGSSVENLSIKGASITSPSLSGTGHAAGILCARASGGTVRGVRVDGSISAGRNVSVGGLIGSVSATGALTMRQCLTDVIISGSAVGGGESVGAGGLIGALSNPNTSASQGAVYQPVKLDQCAAYGSITDWGAMGGLVGYVNNSYLKLGLTDCLSLTDFTDAGATGSLRCGGLLGGVDNVYGARTDKSGNAVNYGYTVIDRCYYAGENKVVRSAAKTVGGIVGGARNAAANQLSGLDYINLSVKSTPFNAGSGGLPLANLYYGGKYVGRCAWPEEEDGGGRADADTNCGTVKLNDLGTSFGMSQEKNSAYLQDQMLGWSASVWQFDDGLYPRLNPSNVPISDALQFRHLAVHYTQAAVSGRCTNLFVRYHAATLSVPSGSSLRLTNNGRMAVATDNATTTPVPVTIHIGDAARTVNIIPSVESRGYRDVSIYYANPDGMWEEGVWEVYTADALAGLSVVFGGEATDQNGLSAAIGDGTALGDCLSGGTVVLARDITDLGSAYCGMSAQQTWRPIGTIDRPFNITLDGQGCTLYDFTMNPFYQRHDQGSTYYYDLSDAQAVPSLHTDGRAGLFGVIDGGVVKNLVMSNQPLSVSNDPLSQPGIRIGMGISAAGALCATVVNGTLENCLVGTPLYTVGKLTDGESEDWTGVPYLGADADTPLGGLVGEVTGSAAMINCSYTGYVYAAPATPRSGDHVAPKSSSTGPVGGLVGRVGATAAASLERSYAAGFVYGSTAGGLVGAADGTLTLMGACYDGNAAGDDIAAAGSGSTYGEAAAIQIPGNMGTGWAAGASDGLYPLQTALVNATGTLGVRRRIVLNPHASSATSGVMSDTEGGATLSYSKNKQPCLTGMPGEVTVTGNTFIRTVDGPAELELSQGGATRRVLARLRCWYDDVTIIDGVRHYSISTAEELWEVAQIVGGTIGDPSLSKLIHTHAPEGGYDDFSDAVIHLVGDVDLATLTDSMGGVTTQRQWMPIGAAHPFAGTFEGNGHAVSGLLLSGTTDGGLFGTVSGTIQNLLVTNATLSLSATGTVGGLLCAQLTETGRLISCGSSGTLTATGNSPSIGGLAGKSQGAVAGCFSTAELYASASGGTVGGITGTLGGGSVVRSYFTGLVSAMGASTVGGITGDQIGGTVGDCYVSAYLEGQSVYSIARTPGANCVYDGRHTSKGGGGKRLDGAALSMPTDTWTANDGSYYPIPLYFSTPIPDGTTLADTPLGRAARLSAAIFSFSGATGSANYARFNTVSTPSGSEEEHFLRSGDSALLSVGGTAAHAVGDSSGSVVLRLCQGTGGQPEFQRPCWLVIPATLAVTYRFNWDDLIDPAKRNPSFNLTVTTGGSATKIRSAADWASFVALANSGKTAGQTFVLDNDINFGGGTIPTVTAPFYGSFDGGNHTLANFQTGVPLFASVERGAKVEFLALNSGRLTAAGKTALTAALVAGENRGRIANVALDSCSVAVTQTSTDALTLVGGLVGKNEGVLDTSYFYTFSNDKTAGQIVARYPEDAVPTQLRMGGLAGINTGSIVGCYAAMTPLCFLGEQWNGNTAYFSALAGLNDGGSIRYSYWRFAYEFSGAISLTAYRGSDGTETAGGGLFAGGSDSSSLERTARWLSADSYGGAYYVDAGRLKLYSFKLARYDLSGVFGGGADQYFMLGLQFGAGDNAMFSNAVCSWQDYLLPNFANLPETSHLAVRLSLLTSRLTYSLPVCYAITKGTADLGEMASVKTITGSAAGGYTVATPNGATRLFLDIKLQKTDENSQPWGVYRKDSTIAH